jgi:hypothetical protein
MMKKILFILLCLATIGAHAQLTEQFLNSNNTVLRIRGYIITTSALGIPSDTVAYASMPINMASHPQLAWKTTTTGFPSLFYFHNANAKWLPVIDTFFLATRGRLYKAIDSISTLIAAGSTNIYNTSGTVTSNRVVTLGASTTLAFTGGTTTIQSTNFGGFGKLYVGPDATSITSFNVGGGAPASVSVTNSGSGPGPTVALAAGAGGSFSQMILNPDSLRIATPAGKIWFSSVAGTTDTTNFKPLSYNPTTGQMKKMDFWHGTGGGGGGVDFDDTLVVHNGIIADDDTTLSLGGTLIRNTEIDGNGFGLHLDSLKHFKLKALDSISIDASKIAWRGSALTIDTTTYKPLVIDPVTGLIKRAFWFGSGGGSTSPAGTNGQVQFNSSGSFGATTSFAWDNTNKILQLTHAGNPKLNSITTPLPQTGKPLSIRITTMY